MTIKMFFKNLLCELWKHNLLIDADEFKGTCIRCRRLFELNLDKTIEKEIDCGEYNCGVDKKYGFVPEAGCPIHD